MAEAQQLDPQGDCGTVGDGNHGARQSASHECDDKKIPWRLVSVVLIAAVVLLVGLPIGTVLIVNLSGCCLTSGPEQIITFWASLIAGFLTLFGMVVTGVFVLTAFKTETNAKTEAARAKVEAKSAAQEMAQTVADQTARTVAQQVASDAAKESRDAARETAKESREATREAAKEASEAAEAAAKEVARNVARQTTDVFLRDQKEDLLDGMDETARDIKRVAADIETEMKMEQNQATDAIRAARAATADAADEAQRQIGSARQEIEGRREEASAAIDRARREVSTAAGAANRGIDSARQGVESRRDEAIDAIDAAQREVEAARQRFDRTTGDPQEDDPR